MLAILKKSTYILEINTVLILALVWDWEDVDDEPRGCDVVGGDDTLKQNIVSVSSICRTKETR